MWAIVNLTRIVKDVCTNDHVRYVHTHIYIYDCVYIYIRMIICVHILSLCTHVYMCKYIFMVYVYTIALVVQYPLAVLHPKDITEYPLSTRAIALDVWIYSCWIQRNDFALLWLMVKRLSVCYWDIKSIWSSNINLSCYWDIYHDICYAPIAL